MTKITTWNIEWMISIFNGRWSDWDGTIPDSFPGRSLGSINLAPISDVPALCTRIAAVIDAVAPDILCIQEGPPREEQMKHFVDEFLGGDWHVIGSNRRSQRLYLLVRDGLHDTIEATAYDDPAFKPFWNDQPYYPWGKIARDDRGLQDAFRRPLAFRFRPDGANGPVLHGLNVHTKSKFSKLKFPHQWIDRDEEAIFDALLQRQKLSAEIQMVRAYVQALLAAEGITTNFLLLGDLNDGPAAELLEEEFLIHNIVDELAGTILNPKSRLIHAMTDATLQTATTTKFHNPLEGGALTEELIDHIMVTAPLLNGAADITLDKTATQVETAAFNAQIDDTFDEQDRMKYPSDHLPVSCVVET